MNVFVVSKGDAAERDHPLWKALESLGHRVIVDDPTHGSNDAYVPQAIISMGITLMDQTWQAIAKWPHSQLYCYNWDVYEWVWTRPRTQETPGTPAFLDYRKYGELLRRAREVWVPSDCTGRRTTQWYGLTNWRRILAWAEPWEATNVRDDGYALCCLREIPDPWWGVFERCCEELKIPYKTTLHELGRDEYRNAIEGCRFICAPLYELSTGGLSLLEAYYHSKPVLLSNSPWNGARDYFVKDECRAAFFVYDQSNPTDDRHFKQMLRFMYDDTNEVSPDHKEWIATNFSVERFARDVHARITAKTV